MTPSLQDIRCLILDIDGVCTNGQLTYGPEGITSMTFHAHDGMGIRQLIQNNITVAVISGNNSPIVTHRMNYLGVEHLFLNQQDKRQAFRSLLNTLKLSPAQCAYVGDDLPDIPILEQVGFACAVQNAQPPVKKVAHYVTQRAGGDGAVREVVNLIMATHTVTP